MSEEAVEEAAVEAEPKSKSRRKLFKRAVQLGGLIALGGLYLPNRWNYIVIHHSESNSGDIQTLQEIHKKKQREKQKDLLIDVIPYHYVVGNGQGGLRMGEIATDWRTPYNFMGAHVSAENQDRNLRGLGICMIGNFQKYGVPEEQYQALLTLTTRLMIKYNIPFDNLSSHGETIGEESDCPGKQFPIERLKEEISIELSLSGIV